MKINIADKIQLMEEKSENDLISDQLMWVMLHRMSRTRVYEHEFIKDKDVIEVDRNDVLLLVMNELFTIHRGFHVYYSASSELDKTFFIAQLEGNVVYAKRFKAAFPRDMSHSEV